MSGERDALMGSAKPSNFTENNQLSDEEEESNDESGGRHGVVFQIRLVLFYILKCLTTNYSFSIATEVKNSGKFDDVIFRTDTESPSGGFSYRLLTTNHKGRKSTEYITANDLLSEKPRGRISLRACLESYLELRPKFTSGQDDIRDLIICTNGKFKSDDSFGDITLENAFEEIDKEDKVMRVTLRRFSAEGRRIAKYFLKEGHSEGDIDSFLDKLRFANAKYDFDDLDHRNKRLLYRECCLSNCEFAIPAFERKIFDWIMSTKGSFFSTQTAGKFLKSLGEQIFEFCAPVTNFTGRKRELEEMGEVLKNDSNNAVVISGLEGIGKSELARKFIQDHSSVFEWIVWIPADSLRSLINNFHRLAVRLRINVEDKQTKSLVKEIYTFFENRDSVFVFDNVEISDAYTEETHYLKDFLPNNSNRPFLILTSRVQLNWENATNISLKEFEQYDAENFIKSNLPAFFQSDEDSMKELAERLHYYPLAMQQAVALITYQHTTLILFNRSYGIDNYLREFEEEAGEFLSSNKSSSKGTDNDNTMAIALLTTFKLVGRIHKRADKALSLMAHFAPDNIDPDNILLFFDAVDRGNVKGALKLMKEFSVIQFDDNKIHIHRLAQKVQLLKLREKGEAEDTMRWVLKSFPKLALENQISVWEKLDGHEEIKLEFSHLPFHVIESLTDSSGKEGK